MSVGLYQAAPAAAGSALSTPAQVEAALATLTPQQDAALGQLLATLLDDVDFASVWRHFAATDATPLGFSLDQIVGGNLLGLGLDELVSGLNLLPSALGYEWQTTVGNVTRTHSATLNVPSLLDVDGNAGPDVIATLSISGTSGVTLSVDQLGSVGGLGLLAAALPLRIEAIVADPRGGSERFAFGYDARATRAPSNYSETVSIGGSGGDTTIAVNVNQSGAGSALSLIAEQFTGANADRNSVQTIAVHLAPVPASLNAAVTVGSSIAVNLGASQPTVATLDYVDAADGTPQPVSVTLDKLPTSLGITVAQSGGNTNLNYSASAVVERIAVWADKLESFGDAELLTLTLGSVPTGMNLALAGGGDSFDLNANGAGLGRIEAVLTSGAIEMLPAQYDGVLLKDVPGLSLISARISGLKRVSGDQSPLSIFLDSTAGRAFKVDLRDKPSPSAKETYTVAELSALARNTRVAIQDGSKQVITYSADAATGALNFATNAGARNYMTANVAPVPASIDICAAGDNACSTSGKPGNTASLRVVTSQHMTVNLFDCQNSSCSQQLRMTNLNIRLADLTVNVGKSCNFLGCLPNGSKGSIWLDTDNHALRGTLRSQGSDFTVQAGFGNNFHANNRYVTWDYFVPSKSGSISCTSGTYLDVTVFGITIDVSGLYLC